MPDDIKTRFSDVWGQDKVLDRVKENIVFLENPKAIKTVAGMSQAASRCGGPLEPAKPVTTGRSGSLWCPVVVEWAGRRWMAPCRPCSRSCPGGIDRVYRVGYPSKKGRIDTYWNYLARIKHEVADDHIERLATISPYPTGATIKDTVNEAPCPRLATPW